LGEGGRGVFLGGGLLGGLFIVLLPQGSEYHPQTHTPKRPTTRKLTPSPATNTPQRTPPCPTSTWPASCATTARAARSCRRGGFSPFVGPPVGMPLVGRCCALVGDGEPLSAVVLAFAGRWTGRRSCIKLPLRTKPPTQPQHTPKKCQLPFKPPTPTPLQQTEAEACKPRSANRPETPNNPPPKTNFKRNPPSNRPRPRRARTLTCGTCCPTASPSTTPAWRAQTERWWRTSLRTGTCRCGGGGILFVYLSRVGFGGPWRQDAGGGPRRGRARAGGGLEPVCVCVLRFVLLGGRWAWQDAGGGPLRGRARAGLEGGGIVCLFVKSWFWGAMETGRWWRTSLRTGNVHVRVCFMVFNGD
jgi:hypothetical protein